jgi:putative flippase GtrA
MLRRVSDHPHDLSPLAIALGARRPITAVPQAVVAWIKREFGYLGKFGVVGAVSWVVDTIAFNAFLTWLDNRYEAAVFSTVISATAAFAGNRFWTWRDRSSSSLRREYLLYAFFNAIGLLIALACLWVSHGLLGAWQPGLFHTRLADNIAKQGFGLVIGTMFRFWAYHRYVFAAVAEKPVDPAVSTTPAAKVS